MAGGSSDVGARMALLYLGHCVNGATVLANAPEFALQLHARLDNINRQCAYVGKT